MSIELAAGILGGAQLIGGLFGAKATKDAANAQAAAQRDAMAAQQAMFERQVQLQEPFRQAGLTAQNRLMTLLGLGPDTTAGDYGTMAQPFGMQQFEQDPGYAFRMSEGMRALERSAAARGGMLSGNALRGITRFGQDLASQEYGNAFNRFQIERQARLNPLQSLMGGGQSAANVLTGAAGGYGQQLGEGAATLGNIRASQYMGRANALASGLQGLGSAYMQGIILNERFPSTPAAAPAGGMPPGLFAATQGGGYTY
jgi:hypothetical protein